MSDREQIVKELKEIVVPVLREKGFKGSFPHFRRFTETKIDLLTFQFSKWGGEFLVELAVCPLEGVTLYFGKEIPPNKVTTHNINTFKVHRLGVTDSNSDCWFNFEKDLPDKVAERVKNLILEEAESSWEKLVYSPLHS